MPEFKVDINVNASLRAENSKRGDLIESIAKSVLEDLAASGRGIAPAYGMRCDNGYFQASLTVEDAEDADEAIRVAASEMYDRLDGLADSSREDDGLLSFRIREYSGPAHSPAPMM